MFVDISYTYMIDETVQANFSLMKNNPVAKSQIHDIVGFVEIKATTQIML